MRSRSSSLIVAVAWVALAAPAAAQIELSATLKQLEAAVRRDSNDAAAHYNVALAYWNAKRFDDADRELRASIALDARFPLPYMGLAFLPYARRPRLREEINERRVPEDWQARIDEATLMHRRALVLDPFVEQRLGNVVRQRAGDFLVEIQAAYGEFMRDYLDAIDRFYAGEDEKAFELFQRVYNTVDGEQNPKRLFDDLIWLHGVAAGRAKKWKEALWDFNLLYERSLEHERRDSLVFVPLRTSEFIYIRALLYQRLGQPNDAIRLYREAIESDVGLFMAHVHLAEVYEAAQMWDQAIAERRHAYNANPDDPSLLFDVGQTLVRAGRHTDAEGPLRDARAAAPREPRVAYVLGVVYETIGKTDDARAEYERFLSLAPSRYARQIEIAKTKVAGR